MHLEIEHMTIMLALWRDYRQLDIAVLRQRLKGIEITTPRNTAILVYLIRLSNRVGARTVCHACRRKHDRHIERNIFLQKSYRCRLEFIELL